jgi:hypothetical protein
MSFRIVKLTFTNDLVCHLPVNGGPNNFEIERVISGHRLAGLRW